VNRAEVLRDSTLPAMALPRHRDPTLAWPTARVSIAAMLSTPRPAGPRRGRHRPAKTLR
jgi:hypothetical protein